MRARGIKYPKPPSSYRVEPNPELGAEVGVCGGGRGRNSLIVAQCPFTFSHRLLSLVGSAGLKEKRMKVCLTSIITY